MEEVEVDVRRRGEDGIYYKDFKMKRKAVSSYPSTGGLGRISMEQKKSVTGLLVLLMVNGMMITLVNADGGGSAASSSSTPIPITSDSATCQCGVFLLGTGTLTFSADAKPVLAGLPVAANCSAADDKISCATICRQLIQAMSGNQENTPLVQTVVLAATRTLACQRFNDSHKVPAPRNFEGTSRQTLAQLDEQNKWKFFVGPSSHGARSDLASESPVGSSIDDNGEHEEENSASLTDPKWLGGYYRWCDEHWIYAGVSLHEPLCCQGHVPKKCPNYQAPTTKPSARNGRRPRLIVIKRCPNNVCEDEEEDDVEISSGESNNNKASPTSITRPSLNEEEDETEAPETKDKDEEGDEEEQSQKDTDADDGSSETINPYTTPAPAPSKPLNATVMSEALKFFETLMEGLGYGDVFEGVRSVLPETHAVQLLERINHGGWLTNYQDRYVKWPREFSLGYCYLEYSMYNVKNEGGLVPATQSLLERVFGPDRPLPPVGARLPQPLPSSQSIPSQNPYDNSLVSELTNYIQPIPQMPSNSFGSYDQYEHSRLPGNRRVRRGVSVARSYSGSPTARVMERRERINNLRNNLRNTTPRRVKPVSRNVPFLATNDNARLSEVLANSKLNATQVDLRQYVPLRTYQPSQVSEDSGSHHDGRSSFVPTYPDSTNNGNSNPASSNSNTQVFQKVVYRNNVPYTYDPSQQQQQQVTTPNRRSHVQNENNNNNGHTNLAEIARPRRHPGGQEKIEDKQSSSSSQRGPMGPQGQYYNMGPPQGQRQQPPPTPKDGPSAGNLLNIANMLMQTAMAGGGSNDGDKVTNMMQTAIPLVAQVANNPAVHNMVNNLVTTFLTPPNSNGPPPPPPHRPSRPAEPDSDEWGLSSSSSNVSGNKRPSKTPVRDSDELNSNEIDEPEISSSNSKPVNARPPPNNGGGASDMIASMVQNMVSSYIKHLFSPGPRPQRPMHKPGSSSGSSNVDKVSVDKPSSNDATESNDIVDVIANAAKPFFISTFGVVPGDPGYGRLLNRRRDEFKRHGGTSKGHNPNDILTEDPDPGTGIFDIIVGPPNFPDTGNKLYDFGNRVVYGFTNANDPHHGVYCFKQYFVNKVWDYFRLGIRAVFK